MGLDEFASRKDGSSGKGDSSNTAPELVDHDRELNDESISRSGGESDDHYNAKSYLAATLHNIGFKVGTEHSINTGRGKSGIVCDVYAEKEFDGDTIKIAGEVGHYDHNRASKTLDEVDVILWAGKDFRERDIVVIEDKSITRSFSDLLPEIERNVSSYMYIDENGDEFMPDISSVNVRYYEGIANYILTNILDMREHTVSSVTDMVRLEYKDGEGATEDDVSRVLEAMGYLKDR